MSKRRNQQDKPKARTPDEEQVLVTAEFIALAYMIAAKDILRTQYGWKTEAVEAFGATLWAQASGMMVKAIENSQARAAQANGEKAAQ